MKKLLSILFVSLLLVFSVLAANEKNAAVYTHPTTGAKTETSLTDAVALVNTNFGGSITLKQDVQVTSGTLSFDYGCTVDLGGHTLYTSGGTVITGFSGFRTTDKVVLGAENNHGTDAQKTLKFVNGAIVCDGRQRNPQLASLTEDTYGIRMYNGIFQMDGVEMYSDMTCVDFYGSTECTDKLRHSLKNSTLVSGVYGVAQFREELVAIHGKTVLDVENCKLITLDVANTNNKNYLFIVAQAAPNAVRINLMGNNDLYLAPYRTWFVKPDAADAILYSALDTTDEDASVSGKIGGVEYSGKNLKHFVLTAAADVTISKDDMTTLQKAIVETAYAYYNKGENRTEGKYVYYTSDFTLRTGNYQGREAAIYSVTDVMSPEQAYADERFGTVCGQYVWSVYNNAIEGYELLGTARNAYTDRFANTTPKDSPLTLAYFKFSDYATDEDAMAAKKALMDEWYQNFNTLLQPGDVIILTGHAVLYVGNDTILENGYGKLINVRENMFNWNNAGIGTWNLHYGKGSTIKSQVDYIRILRPLNDPYIRNAYAKGGIEEVLSDAGEARIAEAGGLVLNLYGTELGAYDSVEPGKTYELTLDLYNKSDAVKTGIVPNLYMNGTQLAVSGSPLSIDIGESAKVTATFTAPASAKPGDYVTITGEVCGLPTRTLNYSVCVEKIDVRVTENGALSADVSEGAWVNQFYLEHYGKELNLPETVSALCDELFLSYSDGTILHPDETSKWYAMAVDKHILGAQVALHNPDIARMSSGTDRTNWIVENNLEVGDIIMGYSLEGTNKKAALRAKEGFFTYIYVGNGKLAKKSEGAAFELVDVEPTVNTLCYQSRSSGADDGPLFIESNWLVVLRPILSTEVFPMKQVPAEPELPAAPQTPAEPELPTQPEGPAQSKAPARSRSLLPSLIIVFGGAALGAVVGLILRKKDQK